MQLQQAFCWETVQFIVLTRCRGRLIIDTYTDDQADGNNVDMDVQSAEAVKTAYWLDGLINQMNGNFTRIRSAIVTK